MTEPGDARVRDDRSPEVRGPIEILILFDLDAASFKTPKPGPDPPIPVILVRISHTTAIRADRLSRRRLAVLLRMDPGASLVVSVAQSTRFDRANLHRRLGPFTPFAKTDAGRLELVGRVMVVPLHGTSVRRIARRIRRVE